ncbi:hypothetical protein ABN254_21555, partial [Providencia rettgeri]
AEIKSELKDYLATLREEGLSLEEVETKMLSMMEELMKMNESRANSTIIDDIPTLEAHPRIVQEVKNEQNAKEEESFEGIEDCYTPVPEKVPISELEDQKEIEMESEDEDTKILCKDEESIGGNILDPSRIIILENSCAQLFIENTFDTCVEDSPLNGKSLCV